MSRLDAQGEAWLVQRWLRALPAQNRQQVRETLRRGAAIATTSREAVAYASLALKGSLPKDAERYRTLALMHTPGARAAAAAELRRVRG